MSSNNIILKNCKICGKPYSEDFYDKSKSRLLCSRECRDLYYASRRQYKLVGKDRSSVDMRNVESEYYMKGHCVLVGYKL